MKGYRTGGDWTDITSIHRNEVVFDGRHKDYGAFYIRKRYPNTLYKAMSWSLGLVLAAVIIPYSLEHFIHHEVALANAGGEKIHPIDPIIRIDLPITRRTAPPPKTHSDKSTPLVVNHPRDVDTDSHKNDPIVPIVPTGDKPDTGTIAIGPGDGGGAGSVLPPPIPEDNTPHPYVTEMPKFSGGSVEDYILKHIEYPAEERDLKVEGTLYAYFVVEKDGTVSSVKILKGIEGGPGLERESVRVISGMPKWTPGKQNGHPARVQFSVPIKFQLR